MRAKNLSISIATLLLQLSIAPIALGEEDPHAACVIATWVPAEILERPVVLRPGLGNASDPVRSSSREAHAFYIQGLNYLHGYVWVEAARSFNAALRHDPAFAMAYWGLSRVYSALDDHAGAVRAAERARELAASASPREQRRIALRLEQLGAIADPTNSARHAAYKQAVDKALAADIDDVELWLIRGNADEPSAAGRGQRGAAASTAFYLEALRRAPHNAAAHHYLTHSYETIGQIDQALVHGEAYAGLSPAIPHAHHMWGHDLRRVGRIDAAIAAFRRTDELEKAYYAAENIPRQYDWHHVHNLELLATSHQHKGQMKQAEALLREADSSPALTESAEFNQKGLALFLLGRERWRDALTAVDALIASKGASSRIVGHAFAGHVHLGRGNRRKAEASLKAAEQELAAMAEFASGVSAGRTAVQPYVDTLRGEMLLRDGKTEEGRALLKTVQRQLRALPGPDAWIQALFRLEAIARMARAAGDWDLAEYTARQMLDHDAAYSGSHLALALVAQQRGDVELMRKEIATARSYWQDADKDLPEMAELGRIESGADKHAATVAAQRDL